MTETVISMTRPVVETFHLADHTVVDPRGFVRPVEQFRTHPWGLYFAGVCTQTSDRVRECWLIPALGLRVSAYHPYLRQRPGPDYRLEFGEHAPLEPRVWRSVTHYLDITVRSGRVAELAGVDALLAANAAGLIDTADACRAVERAATTMDGLARFDYHLENWLGSHGITLN